MEFSQLIEERRSIRHYDESKKVTKEQIEEMVQAAIQAPSWKNSQTARYYAVLSEDKLAELSEKGLPEFMNCFPSSRQLKKYKFFLPVE